MMSRASPQGSGGDAPRAELVVQLHLARFCSALERHLFDEAGDLLSRRGGVTACASWPEIVRPLLLFTNAESMYHSMTYLEVSGVASRTPLPNMLAKIGTDIESALAALVERNRRSALSTPQVGGRGGAASALPVRGEHTIVVEELRALVHMRRLMAGVYSLLASVSSQARAETLSAQINHRLGEALKEGRMLRHPMLAKIRSHALAEAQILTSLFRAQELVGHCRIRESALVLCSVQAEINRFARSLQGADSLDAHSGAPSPTKPLPLQMPLQMPSQMPILAGARARAAIVENGNFLSCSQSGSNDPFGHGGKGCGLGSAGGGGGSYGSYGFIGIGGSPSSSALRLTETELVPPAVTLPGVYGPMPRCVDWFSLFTTALCNKVEFYADASFGKLEALLGQAASGERQAALDRREKVPEDLEDVGPPSGSKVVREREWGGRSGTPPVSRAAAEKVMRDAGSRRSGSGTGTPRAASPAFGHAASALSTIHPNSGYSGNLNLLGGEGARNSGCEGALAVPGYLSSGTASQNAGLKGLVRAFVQRSGAYSVALVLDSQIMAVASARAGAAEPAEPLAAALELRAHAIPLRPPSVATGLSASTPSSSLRGFLLNNGMAVRRSSAAASIDQIYPGVIKSSVIPCVSSQLSPRLMSSKLSRTPSDGVILEKGGGGGGMDEALVAQQPSLQPQPRAAESGVESPALAPGVPDASQTGFESSGLSSGLSPGLPPLLKSRGARRPEGAPPGAENESSAAVEAREILQGLASFPVMFCLPLSLHSSALAAGGVPGGQSGLTSGSQLEGGLLWPLMPTVVSLLCDHEQLKSWEEGPYTIVHHTETVRQLPSLSPLSPLSNPIPSPRHAPSALFNTPILSASPGLALTPIPSTSPTPNHPNFPIPGLLKNLDPASAVPSPLPSPSSLSFNPNHRPSLNPAARPPRAPTGGVSESGGLLVSESGGVLGSGGLLVASDNGGSGEWKRREEKKMAGAAATAAGADATAAGAPDSAAAAAAMVTCGGGGCGTAASADPSALACSQAHSSSALPYPGPASSHAAAARLAGDAGQRPDSQQSLGGAEKSGETGYREYSGEKRTVSPDEKSGEKRPQPEGNGVPAGAASSVVGPLELGRAVEPGRAVESGISGGQAQMHHSYFIARPEVGLYLVVVYQGVQARRQADRQTHEFMRELLGKLQIAKMYKRLRP